MRLCEIVSLTHLPTPMDASTLRNCYWVVRELQDGVKGRCVGKPYGKDIEIGDSEIKCRLIPSYIGFLKVALLERYVRGDEAYYWKEVKRNGHLNKKDDLWGFSGGTFVDFKIDEKYNHNFKFRKVSQKFVSDCEIVSLFHDYPYAKDKTWPSIIVRRSCSERDSGEETYSDGEWDYYVVMLDSEFIKESEWEVYDYYVPSIVFNFSSGGIGKLFEGDF